MKLHEALENIKPVDQAAAGVAQAHMDQQTKPQGSLGRLEEFARRFISITGRDEIRKKAIFTFAGDHGITEEGVSAFPREVTPQMVYNFVNGGAGVNALARHAGAELTVVDMGVDHDFEALEGLIINKVGYGTANFAKGPAMSRDEAVRCLEAGIALAVQCRDAGIDLAGTGDMGIGNTTPSAAIVATFSQMSVADVTYRGTGIDDEALTRKVAVIEKGLDVNQPDPTDPIDVLAKVGGFEIGGIAGLVLGCAAVGIPVVAEPSAECRDPAKLPGAPHGPLQSVPRTVSAAIYCHCLSCCV